MVNPEIFSHRNNIGHSKSLSIILIVRHRLHPSKGTVDLFFALVSIGD